MKIIQSARVAKIGDGNVTVNMEQSPHITYAINMTSMRDILKTWLQTLPEPRWDFAKVQIAELALEICGGNQSMAGDFMGRSRRVIDYYCGSKRSKRKELT